MNDEQLIKANELKKEIEELSTFLGAGKTLKIKIFGKAMEFNRPHTYSRESYFVPEEVRAEVLNFLWSYYIKKKKEYDEL